MKKLVLILLTVTLAIGGELDSLLQTYEQASELSKKTKDESAGNLIIYTREDLERMQVETLKDILKSLRSFNYEENRVGQPDLLNQDPISYYSKSVRVYLNENELVAPLTGSGFILFGDMEMDFIDHVEIYEGFPSFDFGVEPATIVIRLYTKKPLHDAGGRVKLSVASHGSSKTNAYYAGQEEKFSYFVYVNHLDNNKDVYQEEGGNLKRDKENSRFYGSISSENHGLELHAMKTKGDAFLGPLVGLGTSGNIPSKTSKEAEYISLSTHSEFFNKSLHFNMSYSHNKGDYSSLYTPKQLILNLTTQVNDYAQTIYGDVFTAVLKKDFHLDKHTISLGAQYRYKHFDLDHITLNKLPSPANPAYNKENIYSVFIQDALQLSENHLITLSVMNQTYDRSANMKSENTTQLRFGYIYSNKNWIAKTFLAKQEFSPEPYMTISPYYGNIDLQSDSYKSIFQEISYTKKRATTKLVLGYGVNKNTPIIDNFFSIQNASKEISAYSGALEFTLLLGETDKLELQADYTRLESPYGNKDTQHRKFVARMQNSISKFDIFNELVVNAGDRDVTNGYDYSAGVKYSLTKDFHLSLKGENIFNSGLKKAYYTKLPTPLIPTTEKVIIPIVEQKFIVSMEYLF